MKLSQMEKILVAMLTNRSKEEWTASDFQNGKYFIGYEASARMSELSRIYPTLVKVGKKGRYRTLSINWNETDLINTLMKLYGVDYER